MTTRDALAAELRDVLRQEWGEPPWSRPRAVLAEMLLGALCAEVETGRTVTLADHVTTARKQPAPQHPAPRSTTRDLIDALRAVPVAEALARLGCRPAKRRGRMGPCPACGGPEVLLGSVVWKCFRCDTRMDVVGTFRHLGGGDWEGARRLAEECGLYRDRKPVGVQVVKWRDPEAERRATSERWWWAVVMMEAEEAHAAHWSWVDRALMEPEFRRRFERDVEAEC